MVLGRRADHARSADIDVLDDLVTVRALGHGGLERIEVDDHQVYRGNRVCGHCRGMFGVVAHRQQAAVDLGVQRLDATVHHLGKAGELGDVLHGKAGIAQCAGGAAGRHQFDAAGSECLAEFDESALVRNRQQCAAKGDGGHAEGPCGVSWQGPLRQLTGQGQAGRRISCGLPVSASRVFRIDPGSGPGRGKGQAARRDSAASHSRARRWASAISRAVISSETSARHCAASS